MRRDSGCTQCSKAQGSQESTPHLLLSGRWGASLLLTLRILVFLHVYLISCLRNGVGVVLCCQSFFRQKITGTWLVELQNEMGLQ